MSSTRTAALVLALLTLGLYGHTLSYGLVWDDFAALRPRPIAALLGAWTGAWDPDGIWPMYYRPLSIALYDGMFRWLGHNTAALHAVNLAGVFGAAMLLRTFVVRETRSAIVGLCAGALLVLHPETPASLAAWISQQFHLAALLAVLAALLTWQHMRHEAVTRWWLVLAVLTVGLLVKEDVLMVAPTLLVWQAMRARLARDVPRPSRGIVTMVAVWIVGYVLWRTFALGPMAGYREQSASRLLLNMIDGPIFAFGLQWIPRAHVVSSASGAGVIVIAALAWRARAHARPDIVLLALYGVVLGFFANLPLVLASGHTRLYLMIPAAAMTLAALLSLAGTGLTAGGRRLTRAALFALGVWLAALGTANRLHTDAFSPCAPETLERNHEATTWGVASDAVLKTIAADARACAIREGARP
ncbi:MAG: hypothetical protein KAY59_02025 [Acidobacteria bacterium]|nr:hypothetical protein [Acidobacteriota bacterium]